jgi:gliding motility-associated-like protein
MKRSRLLVFLFFVLSSTYIHAQQCKDLDPSLKCANSVDRSNYGYRSNGDAATIDYDAMNSGFHSSIFRQSDGTFLIWGESAGKLGGSNHLFSPILINGTNFPGLTGTILKTTIGSKGTQPNAGQGAQHFVLTTDGLFVWGVEGMVISSTITTKAGVEKITVGGNVTGLPIGVMPIQVKSLFAAHDNLAMLTCSGEVYVLSQTYTALRGQGAATTNATTWYQVKSADAGNPFLTNVIALRGTANALIALKADGTLWTWGNKTYLGDGSAIDTRSFATKMTSPTPVNASAKIKMIGSTVKSTTAISYYVLYDNGELFAMGNNTGKELGDWTTTNRLTWVAPRYTSASGPVMNNIKWISPNEHDPDGNAGVNVITSNKKIFAWGVEEYGSLGLGTGATAALKDPASPPGISSNNIVAVKTAGHTTLLVDECINKFGYLGHAVRGSSGNGSTLTGSSPVVVVTSDFFNTAIVEMCGMFTTPALNLKVSGAVLDPTSEVCVGAQIELVAEPIGGSFTVVSGSASITGTTLTMNGAGPVTIRYTITSGNCNVSASKDVTFTKIVDCSTTPPNQSPVSTDDAATTPQSTPVDVDIKANDSDPDNTNAELTPTVIDSTNHGTVVVDPTTGKVTYTPDPNFSGKDTLTYKICDPLGKCDTAILVITVTPIYTPPVVPPKPEPDVNQTFVGTPIKGDVGTNDDVPAGTSYGTPTPVPGNPSNVLPTINPDGTYTFNPDKPGIYQFNVPVCAPGQTTDCPTTLLTITVLDPNALNNPPVANTDQASTLQATPVTLKTLANDKPGDLDAALVPSTVAITTQPKNGTATVDPATGDITYTPNADFTGNDTLYYKVCDNNSPSLCTNAMQVITVEATGSENSTQAADDFNITTSDKSATGNVLTNDTDPEKNTQTVTPIDSTLPEGKMVINADGSYTFTPKPGFTGPVNVPYKVCDNGTPQACTEATLYLLVSAPPTVNQPPVAVNDSATTNEDTPVVIDIKANDSDPDNTPQELSVTVLDSTNHGKLVVDSTGKVTYTPDPNFSGKDTLTYKLCDPLGKCDTAIVVITVTPVNDPPVVDNEAHTTPMNTPVSGDLTDAGDSDVDGNLVVTTTPVDAPNNGTIVINPDGTYTYTPNNNYVGKDTVVVKICDDGTPLPAICKNDTIFITVAPVIAPPVAINDSTTTLQGTPVTIDFKANDSDPDNANSQLTPTVLDSTNHGKIAIDPVTGKLTYTPDPAFSGKDTLTYKICDPGGLCDTAIVVITVTPVLPEPDINQTYVGVPVKGDVSTNDDVPSGATYGTPTPVAGNPGTAVPIINPDGTYTFNPDKPGEYVFVVPVCPIGQTTNCPTSLLNITVLDPVKPNPPVANTDIATTPFNTPVTLKTLANDQPGNTGVNLDSTSVLVTQQPKNGTTTVNPTTGDVTYTPKAGFVGNDTLYYKVCDKNTPSLCDTAMQIITVEAPPPVPNTTQAADDYNTTKGTTPATGNVLTNDTDPEKNTQTVTPIDSTLPQGKIVINADGSYVFTPKPGFSGPVNVPYKVCDNGTPQACTEATLYILVSSPPPAVAVLPEPDVNQTFVNVPVRGDVSTNEDVPVGTTYGTPTPLPGNPSSAVPTINPDGTYTFTTNLPGIYKYDVPVCAPGQISNCPTTLLTITVLDPAAPNNPPIANTDQASTMQDQPVTLKTLINDRPGDVDAALVPSTVAITTQPKNGAATVNATTGDITYTPKAGFVGNDTLYYKVCDNNTPSLCTNAMQVITVNATGSPNSTQGADDFNRTSANTPATGNVLTNDSDPEKNGQTVTPQNTTLPEGTFVLNADGSYVFTPIPGFNGPVNIPYSVCDNGSPQACTEATLFILVTSTSIPDPGINIPGGFSPNLDGIDDAFIITAPPGSKVALKIYNRWQHKIYQSDDYLNDWRGEGPGNIFGNYVPMGTYYYVVSITLSGGEVKKFAGPLTLVK